MNLLLFSKNELLADGSLVVVGRRALHLQQILRLEKNQIVRVGQINGLIGSGRVNSITDNQVQLEIELTEPPPLPLAVQVILALPRPKVLLRTLKALAELGVKKIVLVNAARVEKAYWHAEQLKMEQIERSLCLGLEQAKDTILPQVRLQSRFRPWVEDHLKDFNCGHSGWVAHPQSKHQLFTNENGSFDQAPHTLAIGPEGGWVDFELDLFQRQDFKLGSWGVRPLSVATAIPALLSSHLLSKRPL